MFSCRGRGTDDAKQLQQAESLLAQRRAGAVWLFRTAPRPQAEIVAAAKKRSVPVISYDRLILNADVDLYLSYDNRDIGAQQAQFLRNRAPKGNYILIGGAPTDHNAKLIREGQMAALEDAVSSATKSRSWPTRSTPDWQADAAMAADRSGTEKGRQSGRRRGGVQRRHSRRRDQGAREAGPGGQSPRLGSGCEPGRGAPNRHLERRP